MRMKKISIIILAVLFVSLITASFDKGSPLWNIKKNYIPEENIEAWINISLNDEPINSKINDNLGNEIKILELIKLNNIGYSCEPQDCSDTYAISNIEDAKNFELNSGFDKIIGLKLENSVNEISKIEFEVNSNAAESCLNQIKIDILDNEEYNFGNNKKVQGEFCNNKKGYGCFRKDASFQQYNIGDTPYCEKILLEESPAFRIGAWVKKGEGNAKLTMSIYNLNGDEKSVCELPEADVSGGEISCVSDLSITNDKEYYVCIYSDNSSAGYKIKGQTNDEPCGFYGFPPQTHAADYSIFAEGAKFGTPGTIKINKTRFSSDTGEELENHILNYLNNKYNLDCSGSEGCVIPIRIHSYIDQTISLSNLNLQYQTDLGEITLDKFHDAEKTPAKINSNGFVKISLNNANFSAGDNYGNFTYILKFKTNKINETEINIIRKANIKFITPTNIPIGIPISFRAEIENPNQENITKYVWDFGDNSSVKTTTKNIAQHIYRDTGIFEMNLKVKDSLNSILVSKSFEIKADVVEDVINETLEEKTQKFSNAEAEISQNKHSWYKEFLEEEFDYTHTKSKLNKLKRDYEAAIDDSDYTKIILDLIDLKIPNEISVSENGSLSFFVDANNINLNLIEEIGNGQISGSSGSYIDAINSWNSNNLEMDLMYKVYTFYYDTDKKNVVSVYNLKISPKKSEISDDFYIVFDENSDNVIFKQDYGEDTTQSKYYIEFEELSSAQNIEFALKGKVRWNDLPVYISPDIRSLVVGNDTGICNYNNICESDLGEDYKNCSYDCKPTGLITLWIILVILIGLIAYIIMQEWYKRYYEKHLFKNKNDLYNLISFIDNSRKQGEGRLDIVKKLRKAGWKSEQITYAYKKLKGKRTGMWEIPVMRIFEKIKLKKELKKKSSSSGMPLPQYRKFNKPLGG